MTNEAPNYLGDNKKKILLVVLIVVAVFLIAFFIGRCSRPKIQEVSQVPPNPTSTLVGLESEPEKPKTIKTSLGEFNIKQPEKTESLPPEKVEQIVRESGVIQINFSPTGISPNEFTVEAGKVVSLVVTATRGIYVFKFLDPDLANIRVGVSADESRGISFVAPQKRGDYIFIRERPGYEGEPNPVTGVMHVK
ncbi:MAG: hypothetical protein ABIK19_01360 [candidate division WOR-3 bacterium]